jgi:hypothetical protein
MKLLVTLMIILGFHLAITHPDVSAQGQPPHDYPRHEVGAFFSFLRSDETDTPGGGGRWTFNFHRSIGFDTEIAVSPDYVMWLAGVKITHRMGRLAVFGKIRPGLIAFDFGPSVVDIGGGFELALQKRIGIRVDFGDLITDGRRNHHFLFSSGLVIRF